MGADEAVSVTRRSVIRLTGAALALPAAPFHSNYLENRRMPFTPTFVDLVRNFTTTTGTGDFELGAAVNGFTSFASAVQPGESFYYSVIGVDKPIEREVGRGSLLANGRISREPVSGPKTNFTSGTKTISLIAAAEWFTSVQASAGTGPTAAAVADKIALANAATQVPALLTESGAEGMFVFEDADRSAAVTADPRRAIYIAPASDATGASGAWVRKFSGAKPASWFGARGDGVTDDHAALQAWLDSGGHLYLPAAEYFSSGDLILRKNVVLEGAGYGFDSRIVDGSATRGYDNQPGSRIRFAEGKGFRAEPQTTETDVAAAVAAGMAGRTQEGAGQSLIRNLALIGAGVGAPATGFYSRTLVHLEGVHSYKFTGKGFDLSASSDVTDGNSEYGGASLSTLVACYAISNEGHGFHIRGRDANVVGLDSCNAQLNGGWGFLDESLLGNRYANCHAATNELGSYKCVGTVSNSVYSGCYTETGIGYAPDLSYRCTVEGGLLADAANQVNAGTNGHPTILSASGVWTGRATLLQPQATAGTIAAKAIVYRGYDRGLTLQGAPDAGGTYDLTIVNKNDAPVMAVTSGTTTARFFGPLQVDFSFLNLNGATAFPGVIATQGVVFSHAANGTSMAGHGSTYDASLCNRGGTLALGVVGNSVNLAAAGSLSAAGSLLSTGGGVGYSAGAGGTVTQTTSKSTGVTLNKLSGQITMSSAALAANTTVSFTLTNSQIAAPDVLILNHASGGTGGAYNLNAQCAAGSAVINVRNVTAGSLSEAIVIRFAVIKAATA